MAFLGKNYDCQAQFLYVTDYQRRPWSGTMSIYADIAGGDFNAVTDTAFHTLVPKFANVAFYVR